MRPTREHSTHNGQSYMIGSQTWARRELFRNEKWADLLIDTLYHYRASAYLLHEFVIMPDHFHVLLTPLVPLEKAAQFIKGGFSYQARKQFRSNLEIWQKGFPDHRIRDAGDYQAHVSYIHLNPVRRHLCERPEQYLYSSAHIGFELDPAPQGLKPDSSKNEAAARLEGAPFQSKAPARIEAALMHTKGKAAS
jgi:putative transposase